MFVGKADRVPELVSSRASVKKAQVHRGLIRRYAFRVGSDVTPCAVVGVKRNSGSVAESVGELGEK